MSGAQLRYFVAITGSRGVARLRRRRLENRTARSVYRLERYSAPCPHASHRQQRPLFLILPWVRSRDGVENLQEALPTITHRLATTLRLSTRAPRRPSCKSDRFRGTCYKAAELDPRLSQTRGRGQTRRHARARHGRSKIFGCIRWRNPSDSSSPPSASHRSRRPPVAEGRPAQDGLADHLRLRAPPRVRCFAVHTS